MKELLTITTHNGLFQYNQLAFGVASAPHMSKNHRDDSTRDSKKYNICWMISLWQGKVKRNTLGFWKVRSLQPNNQQRKMPFFQTELDFCGNRIDGNGLHETQEKIRAIVDAPQPTKLTKLRTFLGMVNHYHWFANVVPMQALVQVKTPWR